MIDVQNLNLDAAAYWLELANGGGVMFRDPSVTQPCEPQQHRRYRQPRQLEAPPTLRGAKDL